MLLYSAVVHHSSGRIQLTRLTGIDSNKNPQVEVRLVSPKLARRICRNLMMSANLIQKALNELSDE